MSIASGAPGWGGLIYNGGMDTEFARYPWHPVRVRAWRLRTRTLHFGQRPLLMGIVNVTPDSFSDGGRFVRHEAAVEHALRLLDEGADILDIGGESTRPYATPVSGDEELARVGPVLESVHRQRPQAVLSIDTSKAVIAAAALQLGAEVINDVTGLMGEEQMIEVAPGESTVRLTVDTPGVVDVEEHESGIVVLQLEVR